MTSFVPQPEDLFPVHELTDDVLSSAVHDNLLEIANELLPTQYEQLQEWLYASRDGILIRDLPRAVAQIAVLKTALFTFGEEAKFLLDMFLEILEKPVLESKSNEKLTATGMENLQSFYSAVGALWRDVTVNDKIRLCKSFRIVLHGGKRPDDVDFEGAEEKQLSTITAAMNSTRSGLSPSRGMSRRERNMHVEPVQEPDTIRKPVVDVEYIFARIGTSALLRTVVDEFAAAAQQLDYLLPAVNVEPAANKSKANNRDNDSNKKKKNKKSKVSLDPLDVDDDDDDSAIPAPPSPFKSKEEELAFFGVPLKRPAEDALQSDMDASTPRTHSTAVPLTDAQIAQENKIVLREYTQALLVFCIDVVNHSVSDCAAELLQCGVADAVLLLLQKDFAYDPRDKRISLGVEILWFALEAFLDRVRSNAQASNKEPSSESLAQERFVFAESPSSSSAASLVPLTSTTNALALQSALKPYPNLIDLQQATRTLKMILQFQLQDGFRQSDKELRNEILIVLTMLSQFPFATGHFISSQLLNLFITYACIEEMGAQSWLFFCKPVADSRNFATISDIDLDFKKQCWNILTHLLMDNDVDVLLCFAASPFMSCLFQYLEYDLSAPTQNNAVTNPLSNSLVNGNNNTNTNHNNNNNNNNVGSLLNGAQSSIVSALFAQSTVSNSVASIHQQNQETFDLIPSQQHNGSVMLGQEAPQDTTMQRGGNQTMSASMILLQMTQGNSRRGFIAHLSPSKLREFQLQAMLSLLQNAPKCIAEFERMQGPLRILQFALHLVQRYQVSASMLNASVVTSSQQQQQQPVVPGGTQGIQDYQQLVYYALILLNRCLINSTSIRTFFEQNQVIPMFLFIFIFSNHEESRAQAIRIVSSLCSNGNSLCQSQMRQCEGIHSLLQPLVSYVTKRSAVIGLRAGLKIDKHVDGSEPIADPYTNPFNGEVSVLILSIIDTLRNVLVGNPANELLFGEIEGIDILLDLLETSSFILRLPILRLISDLITSNPQLTTLINCWRSSKTLRSAAQILCHAWLDEEARLNAVRVDRGIIANLFDSLGAQQWPLADYETPIVGLSNPGGDNPHYLVGKDRMLNAPSLTVNKLTTAVLASRNALQTNLPVRLCQQALRSDTRVLLSDILGSIGMFDNYKIADESNAFKTSMYLSQQSEHAAEGGKQQSSGIRANSRGPRRQNSRRMQQWRDEEMEETRLSRNHSLQDFNDLEEGSHEHTDDEDELQRQDMHDQQQQSQRGREATASGAVHGTGFDDVKLSPRERQVLVLARKYLALREADWWRAVQHHVMETLQTVPIEADLKLMNDRLEYSFDAALATQLEQMDLFEEEEQLKKDDENSFITQVLTKKTQQIKAEWLKRNGKGAKKKR